MLTPAFELSQDENFVTVVIKTPYVKISEVDFFIDGHEFKFHVKPYFLRLNLPGKVVEDGREEASYDIEKGTFTVMLPKLLQGEHFEGLDMLTTLLAPTLKKDSSCNKPLIQVLNSDPIKSDKQDEQDDYGDECVEFNWEIEQELTEDDVTMTVGKDQGKYGFANTKAGIFCKRQEELYEIADVPDPESTTLRERRLARLAAEDMKFDPDHYLADYFEEETIQPYLNYSPPWNQEYKDNMEGKETAVAFTEEEKDKLRHLPNNEYLLDEQVEQSLLLGLVDIIFAFAYNHRTTEGENTVESPWTINKLSSTLCYFETFTNINDVIIGSVRRCLSYPLYRHWKLVERVLEDTRKIFALGRRRLLKCLLEIRCLFNEDDPRFLLNDLYITDYCVWIQKTSGKKLQSLAKTLQKIKISKKDVGWQLEELEKAAMLVAEGESSESSEESSSTDTSDSDQDSDDSGSTTSEKEDENELEIKIGNLSLSSHKQDSVDEKTEPNLTEQKIVVLNTSEEEQENELEIKIGNLSLTSNEHESADGKTESNSTEQKIVVLNSTTF